MPRFSKDALAADNADVLAADNADVLAADTTDVLAANPWRCLAVVYMQVIGEGYRFFCKQVVAAHPEDADVCNADVLVLTMQMHMSISSIPKK